MINRPSSTRRVCLVSFADECSYINPPSERNSPLLSEGLKNHASDATIFLEPKNTNNKLTRLENKCVPICQNNGKSSSMKSGESDKFSKFERKSSIPEQNSDIWIMRDAECEDLSNQIKNNDKIKNESIQQKQKIDSVTINEFESTRSRATDKINGEIEDFRREKEKEKRKVVVSFKGDTVKADIHRRCSKNKILENKIASEEHLNLDNTRICSDDQRLNVTTPKAQKSKCKTSNDSIITNSNIVTLINGFDDTDMSKSFQENIKNKTNILPERTSISKTHSASSAHSSPIHSTSSAQTSAFSTASSTPKHSPYKVLLLADHQRARVLPSYNKKKRKHKSTEKCEEISRTRSGDTSESAIESTADSEAEMLPRRVRVSSEKNHCMGRKKQTLKGVEKKRMKEDIPLKPITGIMRMPGTKSMFGFRSKAPDYEPMDEPACSVRRSHSAQTRIEHESLVLISSDRKPSYQTVLHTPSERKCSQSAINNLDQTEAYPVAKQRFSLLPDLSRKHSATTKLDKNSIRRNTIDSPTEAIKLSLNKSEYQADSYNSMTNSRECIKRLSLAKEPLQESESLNDPELGKTDKTPLEDETELSKRQKCLNCCRKFIAFLFSTVGLSFLLVGYTVLGGVIFKGLEAPNEDLVKAGIQQTIRLHVQLLWNMTEEFNVLHPQNWTLVAESIMINFTRDIYVATKSKGWDGNPDDTKEKDVLWSFPGALLYSVTVITTIGYGHITPKTSMGRIATMLYAIMGIPLTLLTITNLGGFMATAFRLLYKNICCGLCCIYCKTRKLRQAAARKRSLASVTPPGKPEEMGLGKTALEKGKSSSELQWRSGLRRTLKTKDDKNIHVPIYISFLLIVGYIAIGAVVFSIWEEWGLLIGAYFCFITLSTIGFGDYVPGTSLDAWNSQEKLIFCALYLIFGLALIAMCFDLMQEEARRKFRALGKRLGLIDRGQSQT